MDGTLVDSMKIGWEEVILKYLDDRGIKYESDIIPKIVTKGFLGISHYYVDVLGVKATAEEVYEYFMDTLEIKYKTEFKLKKGALSYLKTLKDNGCSINVISASPMRFIEPCLKRLGVYNLCDNVLTLEQFGLNKTDKELYYKLAEKLGVEPTKCTLVEDSVYAIETAKSVGFKTIGIYEVMVENEWQKMLATADKTIMDFTEIL